MKKKLIIMMVCAMAALTTMAQPAAHPWKGKKVAYFGDSITDPRNKAASKKYWNLLQEWLDITP